MNKNLLVVIAVVSLFALNSPLLLVSSAFSGGTIHSNSFSATNDFCQSNAVSISNALNESNAIDNALSSQEYSINITGFVGASYVSTFEIFSIVSPATCGISVQSVNVVFSLQNSSGFAGFLVVSENATTLFPVSSQLQLNPPKSSSSVSSGNWAGYEVYNSATRPIVQYVSSDFNQATPSYPSTGCADYYTCSMSTWVGLENSAGASNGNLAQDGTWAECVNSGCTPTYVAWYEMLPGGAISCTGSNSVDIRGGDSIYASTINEAFYGSGYSNTLYDFYILDANTGTGCITTGNSYSQMSKPTYGVFIEENNEVCGAINCASLPQFGSITFTGAEIGSSGQTVVIYTYTSAGYYVQDTMKNAPTNLFGCGTYITNVGVGSVSSSSSFTATWSSSQYTPVYNSIYGC